MKDRILIRWNSLILALVVASSVPMIQSQEILIQPVDDGAVIWPPSDDFIPPIVVTITVSDPLATEPVPPPPYTDPPERLDPAVFTVHRVGITNMDLPVYYSVTGTATEGEDYVALSGQVLIPAGALSASIVVEPLPDAIAERPESVTVAINPPICIDIYPPPPECYQVGRPQVATAYIQDADSLPPNLPPRVRIVAPLPDTVFKLGQTIPVQAVTQDADGYAPYLELYADGRKVAEQTILFFRPPTPGDPIYFDLEWTNPPAGPHVLTARAVDDLGTPGWSAPIRILVEPLLEVPIVNVLATDPYAAEPDPVPEGMMRPIILDTGTFTVTRTGNTEWPLTVYYTLGGTAANGIDYERLPWSLTIPSGASEARITVLPIDDSLPEGNETVVLTLMAPPIRYPISTSDPAIIYPYPGPYRVGPNYQARIVIADNDASDNLPPRVAIVRPLDGAVFQGPVDIPIFAQAFDADGEVVRVEFFEGMNSLGIATNNPLVMSPINPFHVVWTNPPPGRYRLTAVATDDDEAQSRSEPVYIAVTGEEPPSDRPPVVSITAPDPLGSEREGFGRTPTITFMVMRSGNTDQDLTVYYRIGGSAVNGIDYAVIPNSVTIPAGYRGARVVIRPIDDAISERPETVLLALRLPPGLTAASTDSLPPYGIGRPGKAAGMILDNDPGRPYCRRLDDGLIHVWRPGDNGMCFRVEASVDLRHWEVLAENTVTDGGLHFVDPDGPDFRQRFYRLIPIPCPGP